MAFSFLYFDDCCAVGKVTCDKIITSRVQDHSSEDVFSRPFRQVSEIGGILPFPVDVNTRVKL